MQLCLKRKAFTLVEVSLAITIASVALLAIVSMIPLSYDASRKSVNATRVAQLAQDILSALQAEAAACRDRAEFQSRFAGAKFTVPVSSIAEWQSPAAIAINGKSVLTFKPATGLDLVSHELTCDVTSLPFPGDASGGRNFCKVQIKIWPGVGTDFESLPPYEITRRITTKDLSNAP